MNNLFFQKLEKVLAVERLDAFRQDGASELVTLSRYLWNMALCESLYSPLQMAEVSLRNSIHSFFSDKLLAEEWYETADLLLPWQEVLVNEAIKRLEKKGARVSPGRVVSELHFGFWTGFFNRRHAKTGIAHLLAKPVFAYASRYERDIKVLETRWKKIKTLRNCVFHHERLIHWKDLAEQHADMIHAIGWINPQLKEMAQTLDRFTMTHSAGINPWKEKIRSHWPK